MAAVKEVVIFKGYENFSVQNTLSDHHPVLATIAVAREDSEPIPVFGASAFRAFFPIF